MAGLRRRRRVEVELLELHAAVLEQGAPRQDLEPEQERVGLVARVGLDVADDDVDLLR